MMGLQYIGVSLEHATLTSTLLNLANPAGMNNISYRCIDTLQASSFSLSEPPTQLSTIGRGDFLPDGSMALSSTIQLTPPAAELITILRPLAG